MKPELLRACYYVWLREGAWRRARILAEALQGLRAPERRLRWVLLLGEGPPWDLAWAVCLWRAQLREVHLVGTPERLERVAPALREAGFPEQIQHFCPEEAPALQALGGALRVAHGARGLLVVGSHPQAGSFSVGLQPKLHLESHPKGSLPTPLLFAPPALLGLLRDPTWSPLPYFPPASLFGDAVRRAHALNWARQWWLGLLAQVAADSGKMTIS